MSNHLHKSLADKFNKKKNNNDDISRFSNIHKKTNSFIPVLKTNIIPFNTIKHVQNNQALYHFNQLKTSTNLKLHTSRENDIHKIPKISYKEIPIPYYSSNDKYNLNDINQTISIPIRMDLFASDVINAGDVNQLKKKNVKKIYHVYQEKYADNTCVSGFGDFVRSCFFIMQFCIKYGFELEIIINHPVASFLKNYLNNKITDKLFNTIFMFNDSNWTKTILDSKNNIQQYMLSKEKYDLFVDYLCSLTVTNNAVLSYNIFFPIDEISPNEVLKMVYLFEPSREITEYVDETLSILELVKNNFIVLHIRSGDEYLKGQNKTFHSQYFQTIKNEIIELVINKTKNTKDRFTSCNNILLIADNNEIKYLLRDEFHNIKLYFKDITHLGEGVKLERERIKNTLLDFYIMSYSTHIYSFTSNQHGSGFSYWCSKLYNIPYSCKYININ